MRHSLLLSRYTLGAVLPYFLFVWILLSVVLFVQQGGRYSDLIFNTSLPDYLIWQLTAALVPTVVAFTGPIALLVGVVIGLSRMQGDSEMTAMRAAGVGTSQIVVPILILGVLLSGFALYVNLKGVPFAAQIVRRVALQAALYKLQSPVDPGVFNTEIKDLTIFVKDGDVESGKWKNIFILQQTPDEKTTRLITAKSGFVGTKGEDSEIALEEAQIVTFESGKNEKFSFENVGNLRLAVQTKRGELIDRLAKSKETPEEMGLNELAVYAANAEGIEKTDALLLWQRRILLSLAPLIFALVGTALVTKFNRGGRGFGVSLALVCLVVYYLATLLGEQLARTGSISVLAAGAIPVLVSSIAIIWLFRSRKVNLPNIPSFSNLVGAWYERRNIGSKQTSQGPNGFSRLMDTDIVKSMFRNYLLTLSFLLAMYLLFTAFELWKFAGAMDNGLPLLLEYLFYLVPFVYLQIAPSALMVAAVATFVIKTRQNEVVTWAASGRSVYRLLFPCFFLAFLIGIFNLAAQEIVVSSSNRAQDALRDQIRSRNEIIKRSDNYWIAGPDQIVSFQQLGASDNELGIEKLTVYGFKKGYRLTSVLRAPKAVFDRKLALLTAGGDVIKWSEDGSFTKRKADRKVRIGIDPFQRVISKPAHLNARETAVKIRNSVSDSEARTYKLSLYQKYATPFLPLIVTLFTAPFALSIHRKGNVATIGYAAGLWLLYMGLTSVFQQFGQSGILPVAIAVLSPLAIFSLIGLIMLSRIRT